MLGARSVIVGAAICALASAACTRGNPDAVLDGGSGGVVDLALPASACDPAKLASDPRHCGGCDNDCAMLPNVDGTRVSCTSGVCNVGGACLAGFGDCSAAPGCETNLGTPDHCGSCTMACGGGDPLCAVDSSGQHQCATSCGAATFCNGQCVDTSSDPASCGGCNVGCATPANGEPTCAGGQCGFVCDAGYVKTPTGCVGVGGGGGGGGGGGTPSCGAQGADCTSNPCCTGSTCLPGVYICI